MHVLQSTDAQVQVVPTGVVVTNPPSNVIKIAIKNNQSNDAFFFSGPVSLPVLFTEAGQLERSAYLSMWKSIPDANESTKDIPLNAGPTDLDFLIRYRIFLSFISTSFLHSVPFVMSKLRRLIVCTENSHPATCSRSRAAR
jgi:hypothetical protein